MQVQNVHSASGAPMEQFVPMKGLGQRLRNRAEELGLSDSEVARRCDLGQKRYSNYVKDKREPDLTTLLMICRVLKTTPNILLGVEPVEGKSKVASAVLNETLAARLHPLYRNYLEDLLPRLAGRTDDAIEGLYAFLGEAHLEWVKSGEPFDTTRLLTKTLHDIVEANDSPTKAVRGTRRRS